MIDVIGLRILSANRFERYRLDRWLSTHGGRWPWCCDACKRWMERSEYQGEFKAVGAVCSECRLHGRRPVIDAAPGSEHGGDARAPKRAALH